MFDNTILQYQKQRLHNKLKNSSNPLITLQRVIIVVTFHINLYLFGQMLLGSQTPLVFRAKRFFLH